MKTRFAVWRHGGKVVVEAPPADRDTERTQCWTLTDAEARALATQLVAATVDDECMQTFQEGAELGRRGFDFFKQLAKVAKR